MARSLRLFPLLLTLPGLVASAAPAPEPSNPIEVLADQRADAALAQAKSPRGAAALYRLHELRDQLQDVTPLIHVDQQIANNRAADPFTRATAQLLELQAQDALGHAQREAQLSGSLGFIQKFQVLGAFDNEGKSGCDTDDGPESKLDLTQAYPAKGHSASWHPLSEQPRDGYVDLAAALRPAQEAVGYALTFLKVDRARTTTLALGTSGAYRLWVNGKLASKSDRYNAPAPDQARVSVPLAPGYNRVLLKVCQDHGPFGFYLRQEKTPNQPLAEVALPDALPELPKLDPKAKAKSLPTLDDALAALAKAHPKDAQVLADQAEVLAHTRAFDEKEHTDQVTAARAAELAPTDANLQLFAGDLQQQDRNVRRRWFEKALQLTPDDPRANAALGQLELSQDRPARARELAAHAVQLAPRYAPARILLAKSLEALEDWPGAVAQVESALKLFPRLPDVVRAAAAASRRLDRTRESVERLRVANALRSDAPTAQLLAGQLADMGDADEAIRVLSRSVAAHPFENSARVHLAELLAENGKLDQGLAQFASAKSLTPDDAEILSREGQVLLEAGRKEQAMASFEKALALRPQNPAMQDVVRALKGESDSFGEKYAIDVQPLIKQADAFAGEDAVTIADYTYVRVQRSGLSARFHQLAVKVYSDRGVNAYRTFPITFSPDRQQVKVLRARITKPDGSVVESYGDQDRNMNEPWTGMYYDTRAKVLSFPALAKDDVLELEYRIEDTAQENLLSDYWGDVDYLQGVSPTLRYRYIADLPAGRTLYWNKDSLGKGIVASQESGPNGRTLYQWRADNVSKIEPEPDMPGWSEVASTLHVSTYQTWDQVANYWWGLVRDQLTPNDDLKQTVDRVLAKLDRKDTRAVVQAIYDFVVTNTRYVALEFGIHGYKPYRVDQILARRFGDCKDKASLITAMLKVAGVDTDLVLLRMRNLGQIGGTPASLAPFNHAIAYVPSLNLYLDGTAEFHGSDELPSVDHDADALIVDSSGKGRFLVTPPEKATANVTSTVMDVQLHSDGSAEVKGQSVVQGDNAPGYRRSYQAVATRKAAFEQGWAQTFPGLKVKSVDMSDSSLLEQGVNLSYAMSVPRYAEVSATGLRLFPIGSGRNYTQGYAPLAERKFDLILDGPWTNKFTFHYALPKGMSAADLPPTAEETSPFGHYKLTQKLENGTITAEAEVALTVDRVSAKDYPKFRAFLGRIDQAFQRRIELTKTPTQASAGGVPQSTVTSAR